MVEVSEKKKKYVSLTHQAPITAAADDSLKYIFDVFQRK